MTSQSSDNRLVHFLRYHAPVIVYAAAIILVSSIRELRTPEIRSLAFDKLAHVVEYALFAWLTYRSFSHISSRISPRQVFLASFVFLLIFASFDEFYQSLVPGRTSDIFDIVSDAAGATLVLALLWFRQRRSRRKEPS